LTFDLENLFTTAPTQMMNICGKFHWNPSTVLLQSYRITGNRR